jgi:Rrf2 family iron-sulfur cluster assembly transcriptional regulator
MTHDLWATLNNRILDYLAGISLADMVAAQKNKQVVNMVPRIHAEKILNAGAVSA